MRPTPAVPTSGSAAARPSPPRLAGLAGTAALLAGLALPALAAPAEGAPAGYHVLFASVSCPSAKVCEAVGYYGTGTFAYRSTDGGSSWHAQALPGPVAEPSAAELFSVSCSSVTTCEAVGYHASAALALRTTNGGTSWAVQGLPAGTAYLEAVSCPSATTCTAVGAGAALTTSTGGARWRRAKLPGVAMSVSCASTTTCVTVTGSSLGASVPNGVYATSDGGSSWRSETSGFGGLAPALLAGYRVSCAGAEDCEAFGAALYGTVNGGRTWAAQRPPLASGELTGTCASSAVCVALNEPSGLALRTLDGGRSWTTGSAPRSDGSLNSVSCATPQVCVAVGANNTTTIGTVLRTTNGGVTWRLGPA